MVDVVAPVGGGAEDAARRPGRAHPRRTSDALDEEDVQPLVLGLREQQRAGRSAVTAGAAGLLIPGLQRLRDADVDDGSHVGLVDAHPERVGRDDNVHLAVHEAALRSRRASRGPGRRGRRRPRYPGRRRGLAATCAVLLARAARRRSPGAPPGRPARRRAGRGTWPGRGDGTTAKVRFGRSNPVATLTGSLRPRRRAMSRGHLRRGGRGRGEDRIGAEPAGGVAKAEVVGAEVVAPLRDAVRLVDDEAADRDLAQRLEEAGRGEALGRHVEQPQLAAPARARTPRGWPPRPAGR